LLSGTSTSRTEVIRAGGRDHFGRLRFPRSWPTR
jgi:hypothetical protein